MPSVALHVNTLVLLRFAQLPSIPHRTDGELRSIGFQSLQGEESKEIFSSPKEKKKSEPAQRSIQPLFNRYRHYSRG